MASVRVTAAPLNNNAFNYYDRQPDWLWQYQQPSFYGVCAAAGGGVISDQCLAGTSAVAVSRDACTCVDPVTGWTGCGNTANGVCRLPIVQPIIRPVPIIIQKPLPRR